MAALILLAAAQFVMVLDTSVMNVSITQIVADLDTTIAGVQLAITLYALVMAATMLVGARLGAMIGAHRTFALGLLVYGVGSLTTAVSPNLPVLLFGWSLLEGVGASLVVPAIAALAAGTYQGRDRALAYGVLGGMAGSAVAVGPVLGGWVTSNYSWRWVFVGEVIALALVMLRRRALPKLAVQPGLRMDVPGGALSALGMLLVVIGILQGGTWGWVQPLDPPTIAGHDVTPLGFSPVPFVVLAGAAVLWLMTIVLERRREHGRPVLFDTRMLTNRDLRSGLLTLVMQQLILMGTFFVLPVYLQVVLGKDAFDTGVKLLPLSLSLLLLSLLGPRMAGRRSIRTVVQIGIGLLSIGALVLASAVAPDLHGMRFGVGLVFSGAGAGLLLSQLGNVIMSSARADQTSEAGGLQGTAQNLGASLGTALVGSIMIASLTTGFTASIADSPSIPSTTRAQVEAAAQTGIPMVTIKDARAAIERAGTDADTTDELVAHYGDAQLAALKQSLLLVAIVALLAFVPARRIPRQLAAAEPAAST